MPAAAAPATAKAARKRPPGSVRARIDLRSAASTRSAPQPRRLTTRDRIAASIAIHPQSEPEPKPTRDESLEPGLTARAAVVAVEPAANDHRPDVPTLEELDDASRDTEPDAPAPDGRDEASTLDGPDDAPTPARAGDAPRPHGRDEAHAERNEVVPDAAEPVASQTRRPAPSPPGADAGAAKRLSGRRPGERIWTTRDRIAQRAQSAAAAAVPIAREVEHRVAEAAPLVRAVPISRPGEAAATRVDPSPEPDRGLGLEESAASIAAFGPTRRHAGLRRARTWQPGGRSGGPDRPTAWPVPRRAIVRVTDVVRGDADAAAPWRTVEARARGPPAAGETHVTSIPTATDEHVRDVVHPDADADRARTTVELHEVEPIPVVQAKLAVSMPGDPLEREADAVAGRVLRGAAPRPLAHRTAGRLQRVPPRQCGPPPAGVPRSVGSVVQTGGGSLLDPRLRARIEPHVGVDLGQVRVRREPAAAAAAHDLQARAFTSGSTIFLAAGSSPADLALMAHEATHVAQQGTSALARSTLMRGFELTDLIPDSVLDAVRSLVRAIPGYDFLSTIVGQDLLTGGPAGTSREELVEKLLTYGPFGAAVGPLLSAIDVLGDVIAVITEGLAANNLTFARIKRDIDTVWSEFSVAKGIEGNAAIIARLIRGLLSDVLSFVGSIAARVIEIVRKVVAEVAEPLLETPEFKPAWDLTKKVLHYDPLRGEDVAAETVDIVADFLTLIGEEERLAQMRERGTLQKTADWLDAQLATFKSLIGELGGLFSAAWDAIQPENLPDLLTNLKDLAQRAFGFLGRVVAFGTTLIAEILALIKDSLLAWLSETAHGVQGFRLLTVILGEDPFTGEAVERNATNLIRGFITLLPGGEETYDKLAEAGVIADAASEIESSMAELGISTDLITGIFTDIWDTLTLDDLLDPLGAFSRILDQFGEPLLRLVEFAMVVLKVVITLVLRLLNFPGDLLGSIIATASQAIDDIANDPVAFFRNMLAAVKLGFSNFLGGIVGYLTNGLASWLFRGLGKLGIEAPPDYSAGSILTLVCQVLNLTAERMWQKLSDHLGADTVGKIRSAIDKLTGIWTFIVDVQRDGIRAISRFLAGQLSGLWDSLLGMAKSFLLDRVITVGTTKLLSLLDPTGIMAVVNSFAAFFNAVRSAFEYFNDILQIVAGYVNTLAAVAQGNIGPGAAMLEQGLAAAIPVAIGFLAAQVGLGNVPEKIVELIEQLRVLVDKGIDWLIQKAITLGKAALKALGLGPKEKGPPAGDDTDLGKDVKFSAGGESHHQWLNVTAAGATPMVASDAPTPVAQKLSGWEAEAPSKFPKDDPRLAEATSLIASARATLATLDADADRLAKAFAARKEGEPVPSDDPVEALQQSLASVLTRLFVVFGGDPASGAEPVGVLDLYRGITYVTKGIDYASLSGEQLAEQLVKEEDFSEAVYSLLGITREQAPTTTLAQRRAAAQQVIAELRAAESVSNVRPWWSKTARPNLFLVMIQRFVNGREKFIDELQTRRIAQLSGFTFTHIPFISTTKDPARAVKYATATVVAGKGDAPSPPLPAGTVLGKVFVYLFRANDLASLQHVDIRAAAATKDLGPKYRFSVADKEVTFSGGIPAENRVGEILAVAPASPGGVAGQARSIALGSASGMGGLLPWT
jgi:hypothetical protein